MFLTRLGSGWKILIEHNKQSPSFGNLKEILFSTVISVHCEHASKETIYCSAPAFSYVSHFCYVAKYMVMKKINIYLMSETKIDVIFQKYFVSWLDVKELTFVYNVLVSIVGSILITLHLFLNLFLINILQGRSTLLVLI